MQGSVLDTIAQDLSETNPGSDWFMFRSGQSVFNDLVKDNERNVFTTASTEQTHSDRHCDMEIMSR